MEVWRGWEHEEIVRDVDEHVDVEINWTKMEMKIEFRRIERWEVIGERVSVYHQDCWVEFFTGTRDGQKLTSICNFANFATIS